MSQEKDNTVLIDNAIKQSIELQEKAKKLKKFKSLSKTEQAIVLFKEMRKEKSVKRANFGKANFDTIKNGIATCYDKDYNEKFKGVYVQSPGETTVVFTGKGFLRLVKGHELEIDVITSEAI